ncbi:MAG: hypothetical protein OJF49_002937 [Ktedonobacterales bacterium]|nr:MAG: hypothetical protein OJF49_002937 [Ktedonobacterales bacterium]
MDDVVVWHEIGICGGRAGVRHVRPSGRPRVVAMGALLAPTSA